MGQEEGCEAYLPLEIIKNLNLKKKVSEKDCEDGHQGRTVL